MRRMSLSTPPPPRDADMATTQAQPDRQPTPRAMSKPDAPDALGTSNAHGTPAPAAVDPAEAADAHRMKCMEVWGGNREADVGVSMLGLDAWVYSRPHGGADGGGDVHYVSSCASGAITRVLLADVSGHGEGAADTAEGLRNLMRKNVNRIDQGRLIHQLNSGFLESSDRGSFATALIMSFYVPKQRLTLSNAGHPPPLLYRHAKKAWSVLRRDRPVEDREVANVPLGIVDQSAYDEHTLDLKRDDMILCYSDALVEAPADPTRKGPAPAVEQLGVDGLLDRVKGVPTDDPEAIIPRLIQRLGDLSHDDVTAMLIRRNDFAARIPIGRVLTMPVRLMGWAFSGLTGKR